jgi:hypothetical protein
MTEFRDQHMEAQSEPPVGGLRNDAAELELPTEHLAEADQAAIAATYESGIDDGPGPDELSYPESLPADTPPETSTDPAVTPVVNTETATTQHTEPVASGGSEASGPQPDNSGNPVEHDPGESSEGLTAPQSTRPRIREEAPADEGVLASDYQKEGA